MVASRTRLSIHAPPARPSEAHGQALDRVVHLLPSWGLKPYAAVIGLLEDRPKTSGPPGHRPMGKKKKREQSARD